AACINTEGVPVEFKVATIFLPMWALLPIPVTINLPLVLKIAFTAFSKSSVKSAIALIIALLSASKVFFAVFNMLKFLFKIESCYVNFAKTKDLCIFIIANLDKIALIET